MSLNAQRAVAGGVLLVSAALAVGAWAIPSAAGYAGVGPNFLPWVVALALAAQGALLMYQALRGGFAIEEPPSGSAQGDWLSMLFVAAGVLACAALITRIGFVFACALCFMFAARGLRRAAGQGGLGWRASLFDLFTGLAIAAPVYWVFGKLLRINLPGITGTGWL